MRHFREYSFGYGNSCALVDGGIVARLMCQVELLRARFDQPQIARGSFHNSADLAADHRQKLGKFQGGSEGTAQIVEGREALHGEQLGLPFVRKFLEIFERLP